jgi:MFS transporter, PAT family, beta-lactamase induction signal transducer AmpG
MTSAGSSPSSAQPAQTRRADRSPWAWVPTLYFSQGIPYVVVMTMSVLMYKRLGISNTDIALYTSWLYLPWVIKPLWSPWVDMTRTKRFWIVAMQFLISLGLALAAFSIRGPAFFRWSLFLFWIMAFASATHDIAADGFYMLSLSRHQQAWWVGLRSTFYRTAMIVGSGLLVVLAGTLESRNGLPPVEIPVRSKTAIESPAAGQVADPLAAVLALPHGGGPGQEEPAAPLRLIVRPDSLDIPATGRSTDEVAKLLERTRQWNTDHGFLRPGVLSSPTNRSASRPDSPLAPASKHLIEPLGRAWSAFVSGPLGNFLGAHFPNETRARTPAAGNVGILALTLSRQPELGKSLVVTIERQKRGIEYLGLAKGDKGFELVEGERLVFNSENWNRPALAVIQLDSKLKRDATVAFRAGSGNIPIAWSITLFVVAGLFLAFSCWHGLMLPRPGADGPVLTHKSPGGEFLATLASFFQKPGVLMAVAFILLYRFDEAQLAKVIPPFLLDSREAGGLGLTTSQVGLAYGTFGILALTCGGLLGGFTAARYGLKTILPFMVCSMYLPKLAFIFLSFAQPDNFLVTCATVTLEQLGYGFGFTAFMLYLLYFSDGPHRTAHYAICTGFMALGMMIPGLWSGWVADVVGYRHFFVWVICSAVPGFILALNLKVDPQFGRKSNANPR